MSATPLIRSAESAQDAAACAGIYAPFVIDSAVSFELEAPDPEEFARRIERVSETHPWLVAVELGELVGFSHAGPHRERAAYRWAADVSVYVHPGYLHRGIGGVLYRTLLQLLVRQGIRVACAGITLPNDASVALHETLGFRPVGVYERIGWKAGAWRDVGWWQLPLQSGAEPPSAPGPPPRVDGR